MIIDFHTHCFPDKIASKAMDRLRMRSGIVRPFHNGSVNGLLELQKRDGVDYSVVLNIATNPRQQKSVNDFTISLKEVEGIIPFGSVHHESPEALDELERLKENGIKGVKLHPDYQDFFVDDEKMLPIYEKIGQLGLITVFHCGFDIGYPEPVHCSPERLARVLHAFNGAPVVAAHFGGLCARPETLEHLCGKDVYLDTAYCYGMLTPGKAKELIDIHGADKILMGSDAPWSAPWQEIALVKCFGLSEEDEKAVLGENARKLLGL
ncbi:MAG: amidohydrolase family protein [Clostridia bacterium]|nr:amidohydrolase family protein [Clostridia bacterium]